MIFILQTIATLIALYAEHPLGRYIACVIPIFYMIVIGPGTFTGGSEISVAKLKEQLQMRWVHAEELAVYMQRYWFALWYATSANQRQFNCSTLSLMSFGLGVYFFMNSDALMPSLILGIAAIVLYLMATKVNRPLSIYNDPKFRSALNDALLKEWRLAATALVAFSELFPDSTKHKLIKEMVMNDEVSALIVKNWRVK